MPSPRRGWLACAGLLAIAVSAVSSAGWAADVRLPANCSVPDDLTYSDAALHKLADRITSAKVATARAPNASVALPITIVVLGSGSSAGVGVSAAEMAYPQRLRGDLQQAFPGVRFDVHTLAKRGAQVTDMLNRLDTEVLPLRPTLVIWQIGASDAVEGIPINRFGRDLERGLQSMQQAGIDVMIMDMQYSPFTEMLINAREYRGYIRWIAKRQQVPLLRRYEMMEYWATQNVFDLDSTDPVTRSRTADAIHACVSARTAQLIKTAVATARSR